jgi:hypothetical protein
MNDFQPGAGGYEKQYFNSFLRHFALHTGFA